MATIDDLIDNFNEKPKKMRPRKGNNKARATMKNPDKGISAMVQDGTMAYEAAQALKRGISMAEIAEKYGIKEERLKIVLTEAIDQIQKDVAPILLNYVYMTFSRYELLLQMLFKNLEYDNGSINLDIEERIRTILKEEKEVLMMTMPKEGVNPNSFSVTIQSSSPLYKEANIAIVESRKASGGESFQPDDDEKNRVILNGLGIPRG